jgi:outer membrane lipoprotein SlyB
MNKSKLIGIALLSILLGACASSNSGGVYSREEARKVQTVRMGVVESVR